MSVGFVGMGNMGQMLVTSLAESGALKPGEIVVSNRSHGKLEQLAAKIPGLVTVTNTELTQRCPIIFLCVKPGETKAVLDEIRPYITADHLLVTITNTIDIPTLEAVVTARVAKIIPSLLHRIHEGVSLLMFGQRCRGTDRERLYQLMSCISRPIVIEECQARVASNLTSCGPAFLSYVFRALAQAACRYQPSLPDATVNTMILETAQATCRMLDQCNMSFDDVIARVSTPGGVTADGISILDEQFAGVWEEVVETTIHKENAKKDRVQL